MAAHGCNNCGEDSKEEDFVDVKAVRKEFRVIEDAALAQKLQEEEFQSHYIRNRKDRGTARIDIKAAKSAYLEEVKKAGILTEYELEALSNDAIWLAAELNERVSEEAELERQHRHASELQDAELAKLLQLQERDRIEEARKRRLEKRLQRNPDEAKFQRARFVDTPQRVELPGEQSYRKQRPEEVEYYAQQQPSVVPESRTDIRQTTDVRNPDDDDDPQTWQSVSEVQDIACQNDPEEARRLEQEMRDEEYARRLQLAEERRQRRLVEERDRRLAIKIQKREAEEFKRKKAERDVKMLSSVNTTSRNLKVDRTLASVEGGPSGDDEANDELCYHEQAKVRLRESESKASRIGPWEKRAEPIETMTAVRRDEGVTFEVKDQIPSSNNLVASSIPDESVTRRVQGDSRQRTGFSDTHGIESLSLTTPAKSKENKDSMRSQSSELASPKGLNSRESLRQFDNIAETIDPTFKAESLDTNGERVSTAFPVTDLQEERSVSPSTSGRPVPVIQNVRRKKSVEEKKKRKSSEKCKQQ